MVVRRLNLREYPGYAERKATDMIIQLKRVRLSFSALWEPKEPKAGGKPKYSAAALFPKDHPQVAELRAVMKQVAAAKWGARAEAIYKQLEATERLCLHDGDLKMYDGYPGNYYVSASADVVPKNRRPLVVDADKTVLTAADGRPYDGCYVNYNIEIWAQDHKDHGKRINATLRGVQFVADGDSFAAGASAATPDEFQNVEDTGETTGGGLLA